MQRIINQFSKPGKLFKSIACILIIASLLICVACNLSKSNRFYLATPTSNQLITTEQFLDSSASFHIDFAGEETLRSASSSYSNFNHSFMRSQRNNNLSYLLLFTLVLAFIFIFTNTLRSYGYRGVLKQNYASVCIARYMEHSDGKK